jgi:hypothetical protein
MRRSVAARVLLCARRKSPWQAPTSLPHAWGRDTLAEHCLRQAAALDVIRVAGTFAARQLSRVAFSEPLVASPAL